MGAKNMFIFVPFHNRNSIISIISSNRIEYVLIVCWNQRARELDPTTATTKPQ